MSPRILLAGLGLSSLPVILGVIFGKSEIPSPPALSTPVVVSSGSKSPGGYVKGPNGRPLLAFRGASPGQKIQFTQIAANVTKGQVVGSDDSFDISRLPATFMARIGNEVCTATLIGPKVLLTAAHCVDGKEQVDGEWLTLGGSVSNADGSTSKDIRSCMMAPAYTADAPQDDTVRNENDFALCELALPINIVAEPIALAPNRAASGQLLLIAGYGCTEKDLTGNQITAGTTTSGTLHVGSNHVRGGGPDGWVELTGKIGSKEAILCPGDSGGAAFANASIVRKNNDFGWRVVAVNSAVGPSGSEGVYSSYLAPLADKDFLSFLSLWVARRPAERKICGIDVIQLGTLCRP